MYAVWVPGPTPADPGRVITLDEQAYIGMIQQRLSYEFDIGDVRLCYFDDQDAQFLFTANGAYQRGILALPDQEIMVGDTILVQVGIHIGAGDIVLRYGQQGTDDANPPEVIVDNFVALEVGQHSNGFSIWIEGDHTGQIAYTLRSAYCCRGSNELTIGAIKAALVSAVDPENFPPAFNQDRVYVPGEKFYFQNAVYECIQHTIGRPASNTTYFRKLIDAAGVSNTDIDSRIADWAEEGDTSQIPANKLGNAPSGGGSTTPAEIDARIQTWARANNYDPLPGTKLVNAPQRSNSYIDGRIETWARAGDTSAIPAAKLTNAPSGDGPTDGIPAAQVENFAKTTEPSVQVPTSRLPGLFSSFDASSGFISYRGSTSSGATLELATDSNAGLVSSAEHAIINAVPTWVTATSTRVPKSKLPADIVYGLPTYRGEWNSSVAYSTGEIARTTLTGGGFRFWFAAMNNNNINPLTDTTGRWIELGASPQLDSVGRLNGSTYNPMFWRGNWTTGVNYYQGNVVQESGIPWVCLANHTSGSNNRPLTGTHQSTFWDNMSSPN